MKDELTKELIEIYMESHKQGSRDILSSGRAMI